MAFVCHGNVVFARNPEHHAAAAGFNLVIGRKFPIKRETRVEHSAGKSETKSPFLVAVEIDTSDDAFFDDIHIRLYVSGAYQHVSLFQDYLGGQLEKGIPFFAAHSPVAFPVEQFLKFFHQSFGFGKSWDRVDSPRASAILGNFSEK